MTRRPPEIRIGFRVGVPATPWNRVINLAAADGLLSIRHGVIATQQLIELGISRSTISRHCDRGSLVLVMPGVLRAASHPLTFEGRALAVQLHTAPDGVLSRTTAGRAFGLRGMPELPIRVLVSRRTRTELPGWVRKARCSWLDADADVTVLRGLRLLRPVRTLLTLAKVFNDHRFERAAEAAWHLDLVSPEEASVFLEAYRRQGRGGIARFERWLNKTAHRESPSQSGFELDVLGAIRRAGLAEP